MEDLFSSNSIKTIEKKIDIQDNNFSIKDIDSYFEIEKTSNWILLNNFKKIALQFPDELLEYSIQICSKLKQKCNESIFFILADTSYGNCCVDLVAAEHYNADSIVHYGHSCLSLIDKIPVLLIFEKFSLNLDEIEIEINKIIKNTDKKLIIIYDVSYSHLYDEMISKFNSNKSQIYVSKILANFNQTEFINNNNSKGLYSRELPYDLKNDSLSYSFFYIGQNHNFLNSFLFYFNKNEFYVYDKEISKTEQVFFSKTNRELMKRYYLIEKARDSRIFGILIGTMSVSKYKEAIEHVISILKKAGRRYYSFLIGKLNCPKLNNFMEVDTYVLIACNENSLISSKEMNKPIITIYELEMAFNCARLWGEEYVVDYKQLLFGNEHYKQLKISDQETDISLITGETRYLKLESTNNSNSESSALVDRESNLKLSNYSPAGEFLKNRSWTGLEQNLGQTEVKKAIEGKKGIAANYEDELK